MHVCRPDAVGRRVAGRRQRRTAVRAAQLRAAGQAGGSTTSGTPADIPSPCLEQLAAKAARSHHQHAATGGRSKLGGPVKTHVASAAAAARGLRQAAVNKHSTLVHACRDARPTTAALAGSGLSGGGPPPARRRPPGRPGGACGGLDLPSALYTALKGASQPQATAGRRSPAAILQELPNFRAGLEPRAHHVALPREQVV